MIICVRIIYSPVFDQWTIYFLVLVLQKVFLHSGAHGTCHSMISRASQLIAFHVNASLMTIFHAPIFRTLAFPSTFGQKINLNNDLTTADRLPIACRMRAFLSVSCLPSGPVPAVDLWISDRWTFFRLVSDRRVSCRWTSARSGCGCKVTFLIPFQISDRRGFYQISCPRGFCRISVQRGSARWKHVPVFVRWPAGRLRAFWPLTLAPAEATPSPVPPRSASRSISPDVADPRRQLPTRAPSPQL